MLKRLNNFTKTVCRTSNAPFMVVKYTTLIVAAPVIVNFPDSVPIVAAVNIGEAVVQEIVDGHYGAAVLGTALAVTSECLVSGDRAIFALWGVLYLMWNVRFCMNIGAPAFQAMLHNVLPYALALMSPAGNIGLIWSVGRTMCLLHLLTSGLYKEIHADTNTY